MIILIIIIRLIIIIWTPVIITPGSTTIRFRVVVSGLVRLGFQL